MVIFLRSENSFKIDLTTYCFTGQYNAEPKLWTWYQAWHIYKALNSPSTPLTHKIVISPWTQRIWTIFGSILWFGVWPIPGHKRQFPACQIVNIEVRLPRPGLDTPFIAPHIDSTHKISLTVSIFSILSIFYCFKLIPVGRSVWRFKYFQFRDESGTTFAQF